MDSGKYRRLHVTSNDGKDAVDGDGGSTNDDMKRRVRKKNRDQKQDRGDTRNGGGGSVVWTTLVIGLVFSLVDVIYIMGFVERQMLVPTASSLSPAKPFEIPVKAENPVEAADRPGGMERTENKVVADESTGIDDKQPILDLIKRAGVVIDPEQDKDLIEELPSWSEVVALYGPKPVIYGLDQCEVFRKHSDPADHFVSTAGTFNSGTNLMAELLIANCHMQDRMDKYGAVNRGIRWQVPWGKHTPPGDEGFRQSHKTEKDRLIDANNILPAVTIRDPVVWLHSMCRHKYAANWDHPDPGHCPDFSLPKLEARVHYFNFTKSHTSILHLWNDFYNEYVSATFPRLLVRFEDLVFHPEEVTQTVCKCAGGSMKPDGTFVYIVDSAKKGDGAHGKVRTGYIDAIMKYGSEKNRYKDYKFQRDLEYIRDNVDPFLMEVMGYPPSDPEKISSGR